MSLASRIGALAGRIGREVKAKVGADHPGLARAWVCFGFVGHQVVVRAAHNVASVTRLAHCPVSWQAHDSVPTAKSRTLH